MGIYDRDYYRPDDGDGWWPDFRGSRVTWSLVLLVVVPFLLELFTTGAGQLAPGRVVAGGQFDPPRVLAGEVWRVFTSHAVHARTAFVQVVLFVVALRMFATRLESEFGWRRLLTFTIAAAVTVSAAKLVAALADLDTGPTYGAGGVVTALLACFALRSPRERVTWLLPVPAWGVALFFVALDLAGEFTASKAGAACGVVGHAAGALFALLYHAIGDRLAAVLPRAGRRAARPRPALTLLADPPARTADPSTRPAPRAAPRPEPARSALDEQLEAKLDQVLEKVARTGKDSLSPEEQAILQRASEVFKRRRGS